MEKEANFKALSSTLRGGLRKAITEDKPFLLSPFTAIANKTLGKKKVDKAYWNYFAGPIAKADMAAGEKAQKFLNKLTGKSGNIFKEDIVLPSDLGLKGIPGKHKLTGTQHKVYSLSAPIKKTGKVVIPLLGALKAEELIKGKKDENMNQITPQHLEKAASMIEYLSQEKTAKDHLEKVAKATELLYKQAELGQIPAPKTLAEYQEKVSELLSKDLRVVEEAMKMASSSSYETSLGYLDQATKKTTNGIGNARDSFANSILND